MGEHQKTEWSYTEEEKKGDLKEIHKFLNSSDVRVVFDWEFQAFASIVEEEEGFYAIVVNAYDCILWSFIHECLHRVRPELGDENDATDKYARKILRSMNQRQKSYLYKKLCNLAERNKGRIKLKAKGLKI